MLGLPVMLQVGDLENWQRSLDNGLEDEVAEKALQDMRQHHKEARRLFCGKGGVLRNERYGTRRQIDEIIVADNCFKVLEVRGVCYVRRQQHWHLNFGLVAHHNALGVCPTVSLCLMCDLCFVACGSSLAPHHCASYCRVVDTISSWHRCSTIGAGP